MKKSSGRFILLLGLGFCSVLLKSTYHQEKNTPDLLYIVVGRGWAKSQGFYGIKCWVDSCCLLVAC